MSDPTPTRTETVEDNTEAVEEQYGPEAFRQITLQLLKDIDVSLAMLVDAGATPSA